MSSGVVEARSLSTLTTLAANPPQYPRNPTHGSHEPLVLYIARVPGSKDVFLSPMKPRDKVVTAEDIENSLYFVHFDHPEDIRLKDPFQEPRAIEQPQPLVQRKAVSSSLAPAVSKRKPVPTSLSPRTDFADRQNTYAADYSNRSHELLTPEYTQRRSFDSSQYNSENQRPQPSSHQPQRSPSSPGTCLTLIRRDPTSGAQWNVARIEDRPVLEISSSTIGNPEMRKQTGAPLYIEITNPGYSKFLHSEQMVRQATNLSNRAPNFPDNQPYVPVDGEMAGPGHTFRRRLWMEGGKQANSNIGHRRLHSHDAGQARYSPKSSGEYPRQDRSSMDLRPSHGSSNFGREESYAPNNMSETQSNFRGYVFESPWHGRCEFVTGAGGGSLKCRHLVPGLQGALPIAVSVSELRFNLPSGSKASTPMGDESSKRSSFFHRPRSSRNDSSVSEMDLSLGQEYAGGGFGGKQAKLGKLIIEDEGMKMLDLLVAANVSLWWRAYEKVEAKSRGDRNSF